MGVIRKQIHLPTVYLLSLIRKFEVDVFEIPTNMEDLIHLPYDVLKNNGAVAFFWYKPGMDCQQTDWVSKQSADDIDKFTQGVITPSLYILKLLEEDWVIDSLYNERQKLLGNSDGEFAEERDFMTNRGFPALCRFFFDTTPENLIINWDKYGMLSVTLIDFAIQSNHNCISTKSDKAATLYHVALQRISRSGMEKDSTGDSTYVNPFSANESVRAKYSSMIETCFWQVMLELWLRLRDPCMGKDDMPCYNDEVYKALQPPPMRPGVLESIGLRPTARLSVEEKEAFLDFKQICEKEVNLKIDTIFLEKFSEISLGTRQSPGKRKDGPESCGPAALAPKKARS